MNIREVAKKANVSTATVSRVLNRIPTVNPELRERVLRVIEEENYVRSAVARSMNDGKTFILGLVLPDITNPFFPGIARGVEDAANTLGYKIILCNTDNQDETQATYLRMLREQRVDGIVLVSAGEEQVEEVRSIVPQTPLVWCDRIPLSNEFHSVVTDHRKGYQLALDHLQGLGHRQLALISGPPFSSSLERRNVVLQLAEERGMVIMDHNLVQGDYGYQSGYNAMKELLKHRDFTAVGCANDLMAFGAMEAVFEAGLDVPGDISVVGYDNIPFASWSRPSLTTVSQPTYSLGMTSVDMLVKLIEGSDVGQTRRLLEPSLIVRKSTSRVKA